MAESAVKFLFEKITELLIEERSRLGGAYNEIEQIKLELDSMRAFLRDADRQKEINEGLRTWVGQVRDATYDVEDTIDEFMCRINKQQRGGFKGFLLEIIHFPKNIIRKHHFCHKLQKLKSNVIAISERRNRYDLSRMDEGSSLYVANERWRRYGETAIYMDEDEIVGFNEREDQLVRWLTEDEPRRAVLSVVGMGGLGKTTLVAKVYKAPMVKRHFECAIWVSVSQSYSVNELLRNVLQDIFQANKVEVPSNVGDMNHRQLVQMVNDCLEKKRYIIVLDDVWSIDAWTQLNTAFPRNRRGSRILLTTRDDNVTLLLGEGSTRYELKCLEEEVAWELFCKKAFWSGPCPRDLVPVARTIVEKCGGLPLAIVALSSLLSLKDRSVTEWGRVSDNLSWHWRNNQILEPIKLILLLSFYDLPFRLKHCFLYCCMFPEDYLIYRRQLMRLWVAEGFVEERGRLTVEEAAEDNLKELVHRNLLQVAMRNETGRVRACRVHDLMREVALSLSHEEKFCMTYDGQQTIQDDKVRRMSIYRNGEISNLHKIVSHLRSLLVFATGLNFVSSLNEMAPSFKLLKVLNLEGIPIESVPDELSNLFNLRYLNLGKTKIRELPKSIGRLQNLQTLDVRHTRMEKLPSGIVKLRKLRNLFNYRLNDEYSRNFDFRGVEKPEKLRHLFVYRVDNEDTGRFDYHSGIQVPLGICNLTSLQSLSDIEVKEGEVIRQVGNLTQLRSLGISKLRSDDGGELCESISKMEHLISLGVKAISEEEPFQLEGLSPPLLQKLYLNGHFESAPQSFRSLRNLTHLWLRWSRMRTDGMLSSLHALPNLVYLELWHAYEGQQLCFLGGWFPKLKKLNLWDLKQLNRVVIEVGAMPSIREMDIARCRELKMLPEGIENLTTLQELFLDEMPTELVDKLKGGREEDRRKVEHIPIIKHEFWTDKEGWV
ncbi:hypothetical protein ACLOJK_041640, partial [Asimina triloba]